MAKVPWLVKHCAISYCYSIPILLEMLDRNHQSAGIWTLAPTFDSSFHPEIRLAPLAYTQDESKRVAHLFSGTYSTGDEATKEHFMMSADQYSMIHLATHAAANRSYGNESFISFQPNPSVEAQILKASEIYGMTLPLDLMSLSACETASGELIPGEGIIGLSRSMAYAGVKRLMTTLWQVDDRSTYELVTNFYEALKSGLAPSHALRKSKVQFIQRELNGPNAHPFTWAGLILIGDPAAITFHASITWLYYLIPLALFLFVLLRYRKFQKKN